MPSARHHSPAQPAEQTRAEIDRRMAAAARTEERGQYREAARLYGQLGKEIQSHHGRFDSRALDAYEGVARAIRKSATTA